MQRETTTSTDAKSVHFYVMSIGDCAGNDSVRWLKRIGAPADSFTVVLPKTSQEFVKSYDDAGVDVYLYDESKYVKADYFEFFGFKPRNCGGVGRQGIAEAINELAKDDEISVQIDDDTSGMAVRRRTEGGRLLRADVRKWSELADIARAMDKVHEATGIEPGVHVAVGAGSAPEDGFRTWKRFNFWIMRKGNQQNYYNFAEFVSDDIIANMYYWLQGIPQGGLGGVTINFKDGQASRADGNDAIYRSDASWKKAYALRMTCPWASHLQMKREQGGFLFREFLLWRHLAPVPMLKDEQGRYYSINKTEGETDDDKG